MKIFEKGLTMASFQNRTSRFTVDCLMGGKQIKAYLPNPGRLWEILLPGRPLYLEERLPVGRMRYTVIAADKDGVPVPLHTLRANTIVEKLLEAEMLPGYKRTKIIKREATSGDSRFDFLLQKNGAPFFLEVKSCTLFNMSLAMFSDAPTIRGRRHLNRLYTLSKKGTDCGFDSYPFLPDMSRLSYHMDIHMALYG